MVVSHTRPWRNWSRSVLCIPQQVAKPANIDELVQIIKACSSENRHVRVAGSGHSFTPLVQTNDVLLSLEHLQGIEEIDAEQRTVTVRGGTTLKTLGEALYARGLAQENLGASMHKVLQAQSAPVHTARGYVLALCLHKWMVSPWSRQQGNYWNVPLNKILKSSRQHKYHWEHLVSSPK